MSIHSANHRFSPSTPRTVHLSGSVLRQLSTDEYPMTESPLDFREMAHTQRTRVVFTRGKYDHDHDHDMDHCSEQNDEREHEEGQDDDLDEMMLSPGKRQRLSNRSSLPTSAKYSDSGRKTSAPMEVDIEVGEYEDEQGSLASAHSSRKPSVSGSVQGDDKLSATKSKSSKTTATATPATQKRMQRRASDQMTLGEVIDKIDEEIHPEDEPQSLAGKGLRIYAQCVRRRVEARGSTSYNELVHELFGGKAGENVEDLPEVPGQENIRRRVYDALNVLEALDIISFDNKDIRWVGLEESKVVQDVSQRKATTVLVQQGQHPHNEEGDEESEEPEDDDMEIEKLQKEVEALKLQNELERAQLQDQVTRHVQVLNLVKRNKKKETKEQDKEERRRQRKEEKRARALAADQDPSMTDVGPIDCTDSLARKADRHYRRRRRSSRDASERPQGEIATDSMDDETHMKETEDEEARQRRKQERRERRERRAKKAQKSEKHDRVQLPFFAVRMPGYTQSSDSEENISVVRTFREEQKPRKSGKSKRHCESTGEETTRVRIQIPQNSEELSIISDTEILGDLGFNAVTLDDLQAMLPSDLMESAQYVISARDHHRQQQHQQQQQQQRSRCRDSDISAIVGGLAIHGHDDPMSDSANMSVSVNVSGATNVIVCGGHEREIVRATS
ncbi:Transcription factor Dp-2 [Linnemannia exigua]|uniref:Transcription factor Dp-2 n=1 Tax=Linnemannia exigua TaxID=604196 RepID=A0AAD4HAH4_9FUNG|nr:Transcription factor Dp-2 [Linnemannia exigua]